MKNTAALFASLSSIQQLADQISERDTFETMMAQITFGPRKLSKSSMYQLYQMRKSGHVQKGE